MTNARGGAGWSLAIKPASQPDEQPKWATVMIGSAVFSNEVGSLAAEMIASLVCATAVGQLFDRVPPEQIGYICICIHSVLARLFCGVPGIPPIPP